MEPEGLSGWANQPTPSKMRLESSSDVTQGDALGIENADVGGEKNH